MYNLYLSCVPPVVTLPKTLFSFVLDPNLSSVPHCFGTLLQDKDRHYDASLKHHLNLWEEALDKLYVAAVHRASTLLTAEHFPQTESIALALENWKQAFATEWASLQNDHAFNAKVSQQEVGRLR